MKRIAVVASLPLFTRPTQLTEFGYVASVTPKGGGPQVTVAKFVQLLKTKQKDCGTPYLLHSPCRLGFWLRYRIDTVKAPDQQYQP